jgi:phosphohistidine phosphatase
MEILLVRHGQAGKPDAATYPDDDQRLLTPKGRKAFKSAGKGLRSLGLGTEKILVSPAERTRETAELLARALDLGEKDILAVAELHHAIAPVKALGRLSRLRLPRRIALVGHEPWLGEFLALLIAGDTHARFGFAKGGAGLVEATSFAKDKGSLVWLMTQDQLAALA